MEERCVCCGDIIPEGRQVCPNCEYKYSGRKEEGQRIKPELDEILEFCEEIEGLLYISDMRSRRPGEYTRSGEVRISEETAEILRKGIENVKRLCNTRTEDENPPLMLDELGQMDGDPVWIVAFPDWGHWELSEVAEDYLEDRDPDLYGLMMPPSLPDPMGKYGLNVLGWLAYRRKPEVRE